MDARYGPNAASVVAQKNRFLYTYRLTGRLVLFFFRTHHTKPTTLYSTHFSFALTSPKKHHKMRGKVHPSSEPPEKGDISIPETDRDNIDRKSNTPPDTLLQRFSAVKRILVILFFKVASSSFDVITDILAGISFITGGEFL